jgi:quercetin dioxygenase-like cupin family protein
MILRKLKEVEHQDVGRYFGLAKGVHLVQWLVSNDTGGEGYQHNFAVRKFTMQPAAKLEDIPFHHHAYEQCPHILKGRVMIENDLGEKYEAGPGDTIYIRSNEPHRVAVIGDETVELICIIDCPGTGEDCDPVAPRGVMTK